MVCYVALQVTFLLCVLEISHNKNKREMSAVPFFALLLHCLAWTIYDMHRKDAAGIILNLSGIIVGLIGIVTYQLFSRIAIPAYYYGILVAIVSLIVAFLVVERFDLIHYVGSFLIVALMGSQLVSLPKVIATKYSASTPLMMRLVCFRISRTRSVWL